jgi:hypothetical protein
MRHIPIWRQKLILFLDEHPILSLLFSFALLSIVVYLIHPLFVSVPIPEAGNGIIVNKPISVIPGNSYDLTIRATKRNMRFDVREGNEYLTIVEKKEFSGPTPRERITVEISSPPLSKHFKIYYAQLNVYAYDAQKKVYSNKIHIRIDTFALPFRLLTSLILAAPSISILNEYFKKSDLYNVIDGLLKSDA